MNPILRREFFARWRDWRSHLLLFGLAVLLCVAVYYNYNNAVNYAPMNYRVSPPRAIPESLATRASRAGHSLFTSLAIGNVLVVFLMAPLLTATGIARERERGLLESLQLSHMTPVSQLIARALSALLYLFALQLMTLPVYFVAFSFGGVAPGDIAKAWLLVATTAWCGVGLGLMISASVGRPSSALFGAVALLCGWSFAAYLGKEFTFAQWGLLGFGPSTRPLAQLMYWSHPFVVISNLCEPATILPTMMPWVKGASLWDLSITLPLCALVWFCIGAFGLRKAARDVTRAFAPAGWAGSNPIIEEWKRERQTRVEAKKQKARSVEGALLADLPFDRLIRFKNPLLNREVRARFRLRRASVPVWFGRAAVFLFAAGGWIMGMALVFDGVGRPSGAPMVMWMEWVLGVVLVGTFASAGFAREREAGTWEGIRLSLLSNWQIACTKWASPLISFALLTCPLWILLLAFAPIGNLSGLPVRLLLSGASVIVASLGFISALALWISLRARTTTTSTCWTVGILLFLMCGAPYIWLNWGVGDRIASSRVGIAPYGSTYPWSTTEYNALYTRETGQQIPPGYSWNAQELARYSNWLDSKRKHAQVVSAFTGAWNPALVLGQMTLPTSESATSSDNLVQLSLIHSLLCCAAIALLLGNVTLRLNDYMD